VKHKAEFTTQQLRRAASEGRQVLPVFGRPVGAPSAKYDPRTRFDPKPWSDGTFRYSAWELTVEGPSSGQLADQRHMVEDTTDFVRRNLACAGALRAGVAA